MKSKNRFFGTVPLLLLAGIPVACAETTWPIESVNTDHPLGNTMGEFVQGDEGAYQHEGIDVLGDSFDKPEAPFVVVTVGGQVDKVVMNPDSRDNYILVRREDGRRRYLYAHLEYSTVDIPIVLHMNNTSSPSSSLDENLNRPASWPELEAGDRIAQLTGLFPCEYDHVHYEVQRINDDQSVTPLNPLLEIEPRPDQIAPEIAPIHLAQHDGNRWNVIPVNPDQNSCTVVSGDIDIVVEVMDRDDGGSNRLGASNVGLHSLRWRACKNIFCRWKKTHTFDEMPAQWTVQGNAATSQHFSTTAPWQSTSNYCADRNGNRTFMVPTSFTQAGSWKTDNGDYPNDEYAVSVEAKDVANNDVKRTIQVCVENPAD